jgi:hypothetical protein
LYDFTFYTRKNATIPITENDDWVLAFDIWPDELLNKDDEKPSTSSGTLSLTSSVETIDDDDILIQGMSQLQGS